MNKVNAKVRPLRAQITDELSSLLKSRTQKMPAQAVEAEAADYITDSKSLLSQVGIAKYRDQ